jgi:putative resolvase
VPQAKLLEAYCTAKEWHFEIILDLGCGMNYQKKGLQPLLEMILERQIRRLVLLHKDRLLCPGAELVFALCEIQNMEIVVVNKRQEVRFAGKLARDVLELIDHPILGPALRQPTGVQISRSVHPEVSSPDTVR